MLEAVQGKSRRIEKTEKEKSCLFLIQECYRASVFVLR